MLCSREGAQLPWSWDLQTLKPFPVMLGTESLATYQGRSSLTSYSGPSLSSYSTVFFHPANPIYFIDLVSSLTPYYFRWPLRKHHHWRSTHSSTSDFRNPRNPLLRPSRKLGRNPIWASDNRGGGIHLSSRDPHLRQLWAHLRVSILWKLRTEPWTPSLNKWNPCWDNPWYGWRDVSRFWGNLAKTADGDYEHAGYERCSKPCPGIWHLRINLWFSGEIDAHIRWLFLLYFNSFVCYLGIFAIFKHLFTFFFLRNLISRHLLSRLLTSQLLISSLLLSPL